MNGKNDAAENLRRYAEGWNREMIDIWTRNIESLDVIDTGALWLSPNALPVNFNANTLSLSVGEEFLEYGIWQDYGVGKEVPRGNAGDIGRDKVRKRKRWFSGAYYSSVMNIKDKAAEVVGKEFAGVFSDALKSEKFFKTTTDYYKRNKRTL